MHNIAQAAQGTAEVSEHIASVAGTADRAGTAAGQVLAGTGALSEDAERLSAEVVRFLQSVRAA